MRINVAGTHWVGEGLPYDIILSCPPTDHCFYITVRFFWSSYTLWRRVSDGLMFVVQELTYLQNLTLVGSHTVQTMVEAATIHATNCNFYGISGAINSTIVLLFYDANSSPSTLTNCEIAQLVSFYCIRLIHTFFFFKNNSYIWLLCTNLALFRGHPW